MTVDPLAVVGAIAAMGGLLLFIVRAFASGSILPRSTVPREDYDRLLAINAVYADRFDEQTRAVRELAQALDRHTAGMAT